MLCRGILLLAVFGIWTVLIMTVNVQPAGQQGTDIGFAGANLWFHRLTGVHMSLYHITDWLGLVPVFAGLVFAGVGAVQLVRRRSLLKVDGDILILGVYYIIVIAGYLAFEIVPINYRPVLIEGRLEASYPSSTTLLVLSVMPTLVFQAERRLQDRRAKLAVRILSVLFSLFMVAGRLVSGVHWLTDIIGSVLLSGGLFYLYIGGVFTWNFTKNCRNCEKNGD